MTNDGGRDDDNDDDNDSPFAFFGGEPLVVVDDEEDAYPTTRATNVKGERAAVSQVCAAIDKMLILRQPVSSLSTLRDGATDPAELQTLDMADCILTGSHERLICELADSIMMRAPTQQGSGEGAGIGNVSLEHLLEACLVSTASEAIDSIRRMILEYIEKGENDRKRECRAMQCHILAIAYLEVYCQANYTGPELNPASTHKLHGTRDAQMLHASAIRHLECDGEWAYTICELPHTLFLSRCIFLALAEPMRASWDKGIVLTENGEVQASVSKINFERRFQAACQALSSIRSGAWRSARAAVVHARLLQLLTHNRVPTLWKECCDWFALARGQYGCRDDVAVSETDGGNQQRSVEKKDGRVIIKPAASTGEATEKKTEAVESPNDMILQTQLWLEWGLCCHHFSFGDKGKRAFRLAQQAAQLDAHLTGAMGKRTKHQQIEHAQMLLIARSTILKAESSTIVGVEMALPAPSAKTSSLVTTTAPPPPPPPDPNVWEHSEWEMGRRLITEVEGGEEASVREVLLDSMDGGAVENIFLEGGPKFTDTIDQGGELHPVDQAVVLALCLDVNNSNPADGLTTEVMMPYLTRVLALAKNWMIHSTGLLERSWLEFEQRRTADRAMLQIQALLDQHTTRLTIMQSTYKSIHEDSAPAQDRLHYLHCIVYPAQYELKKDLAHRYLQSAVVVSALGLFRELELWDEVVKCYQLMEKPHRAELVVRDRLKFGETPYMLTALADLTSNEELYEKAWELSRGRYGRAKRTLAKICYDRGDFRECANHLEAALAIHPLVANSWYLKGLATMRLESWDEALMAFTRCIQQDMEIGEAWANCGAIHMRMRRHINAYASLKEAVRYKRESWQIIENLMICCLVLEKWHEAVLHMNRLLDLRGKSDRPVHIDELRHLSLSVADRVRAASETTSASEEISDADLPEFAKGVEKLLVRITNTLRPDPAVWDILARFQAYLGRKRCVLDCRVRQFRSLTNEPSWEKDRSSVSAVLDCAELLVEAHDTSVAGKEELYACNSLLQSAQRRLDVVFQGMDESKRLEEITKRFGENVEKKV